MFDTKDTHKLTRNQKVVELSLPLKAEPKQMESNGNKLSSRCLTKKGTRLNNIGGHC